MFSRCVRHLVSAVLFVQLILGPISPALAEELAASSTPEKEVSVVDTTPTSSSIAKSDDTFFDIKAPAFFDGKPTLIEDAVSPLKIEPVATDTAPLLAMDVVESEVVVASTSPAVLGEKISADTTADTTIETTTVAVKTFFDNAARAATDSIDMLSSNNASATIDDAPVSVGTGAPILPDDAFVPDAEMPLTAAGTIFQVRDAVTDEADLGGGQKEYRIYAHPRLIGTDKNDKLHLRVPGWNLFHQQDGSRLKDRTAGYRYEAPLGNGQSLTVAADDVAADDASWSVSPRARHLEQSVDAEGSTISFYKNMYPGVDVTFRDHGAGRSKTITINQLPPKYPADKDVVFWETFTLPEGATVLDGGDKVIEGASTQTDGNIFIKLNDGTTFMVGAAIIFDATRDEMAVQPLTEKIKIAGNILSVGLVVPASYMATHQFPLTIDPDYYVCAPAEASPSISCSSLITLYTRTPENDRFATAGQNDLALGLDKTNSATREPILLFNAPFSSLVGLGSVRSAVLNMFQTGRIGNGNYNGTITIAARRITTSWSSSTVKYSTVRNSLSTVGTTGVSNLNKNQWFTWDVTSAVTAWAGGTANNGLLLEPTPAWTSGSLPSWPNRIIFLSNASASTNPYLTVTVDQPDLTSTGQDTLNTTAIHPGDVLTGTINVKNIGLLPSGATNIGFYLKPTCINLTNQIGSNTLGAIFGNQVVAKNFSVATPSNLAPGTYCLGYKIDDPNMVKESNEGNNSFNFSFDLITVTPLATPPDLVKNSDFISTYAPIAGNTVNVSVVVKNQGGTTAGPTSIYYYWNQGSPSYSNNKILTHSLPSLSPNAQVSDDFSYTIPASPGTYYLSYWIDGPSNVSESNENNNQFALGPITVVQPNDIAATSLVINNPRTYYSGNGDNISLNATVKNNTNNALSNVAYRLRLLQNGGATIATLSSLVPATINFSANSTQTITLTGTIPSGMPSANYFVEVTLDPSQTLGEPDITNNTIQTGTTAFVQYYYPSGGGGGSGGGSPGNVAVYTGTAKTPVSNPAATLVSVNTKKLTATNGDKINGSSVADPVNARTGAFEFEQTDFSLPGRGAAINFTRTYNSKLAARSARFGNGWSSSYDSYYYQDPTTKNVQVYLGGALASYFTTSDGGVTFTAEKGDPNSLTVQTTGLTYQAQNGTKYVFSLVSATNLGTLDKIIDAVGNETTLQYNTVLNVPLLTSVTDPSNRKITFSYPVDTADPKWDKVIQMSETIAGVTLVDNQYFYDSSTTIGYNLTKVVQNRRYQGQTETITHLFDYDSNGQLVTYTNPRGTKLFTDYEAGATGRVTKQWEGNEPRYGAGDKRLIYGLTYTDTTDPAVAGSAHCTLTENYRDATNHYDEYVCFNSDELKMYSRKGSIIERWTYDVNGMPSSYSDGVGNITGYTYDGLRRLAKQTLPDTSAWHTEVSYQYAKDPFNWVSQKNETVKDLATSQVTSRVTTYAVNVNNGQINSITYPLNFSESFTYNPNGTVASFTDKNNNTTAYSYDATGNYQAGESIVVVDADGVSRAISKQYTYDSYGNIATLTDGNGKITANIYDSSRNLRQSTDAVGTVMSYTYDLGDHRTSQITTPTVGSAHVVNFTYDTDLNASLLKVTKVKVTALADIVNSRAYDYVGNVVSEIDPNGVQTNYTYDSANRVISQSDPIKVVVKEYFDNGQVKKETVSDPASPATVLKRTDFMYDSRGNKVEEDRFINAVNFVALKWVYDGFNRVIKQTDGNGNDTLFSYDNLSRLTTATDPLGNPTTYFYDGNGNKVGVILPRAQTNVNLRNADGKSITFAYDALGRQIKQTNADNKVTKQYYDDANNLTKVIDRQNSDGTNNTHVTRFEYDAINRQTGITFADNTTASSTYDGYGSLASKRDQTNRITNFYYDEFGRLDHETDNGGMTTRYTYFANGNKRSEIYPDTTSVSYTYDAGNRLRTVTDIQNGQRIYTYDALGNKLTDQDKLGHVTSATYDQLGRLISETNPAGTVTLYEYDKNNNRTSESVAGRAVSYEYDTLNHPTLVYESGTGLRKTYAYDSDGNKTTVTGKRNEVTQYGYDKLGRLVTKQLPLGFVVTYQYDNWDNWLSVVDENNSVTNVYDLLNRPVAETKTFPSLASPYTITRAYAPDGQLSSLTDAAGRNFIYAYDNRGLLETVSFATNTLARYTYNSFGKPKTIAYGNGAVTTYGYDTLDRATSIETKSTTGTILFKQEYAYDAQSNRTRLLSLSTDDASTVTTSYTYDVLDQLTDVDYDNVDGVGNDLTYRYDIYGNRTSSGSPVDSASYTYNTNSNLLATVTYDSQLTITSAYDQSGSLQKETYSRAGSVDKTVDYWWDDRDRLVDIMYTHAQNSFLPTRPVDDVRFAYDDNNNRIAKIVGFTDSITPTNCQSATTVNCQITFYINDGLAVLNEVDGTGAVTKSIVRGLGQVAEIDALGAITYVHQDVLGSAVLLTDQTGEVVQRYEYDPFGQVIGQDGSADTKYTYTGQEYDGESELYYYNARYYNPRLGRFISRDPYLGRVGDSLSRNGYNYVKNNPLKYVDPSGEVSKTVSVQYEAEQQSWLDNFVNALDFFGSASYEYTDSVLFNILPDQKINNQQQLLGAKTGAGIANAQGIAEMVGGAGAAAAGTGMAAGSLIGGGALCLETAGAGCVVGGVGAITGETVAGVGAAVGAHGGSAAYISQQKLNDLNSGSRGGGGSGGGSYRSQLPNDDTGSIVNLQKTSDGKFRYFKNGQRRSPGSLDFILQDGQLKFGANHSFISKGRNVDYAGQIKFTEDGQVKIWTNGSGHYQPKINDSTGINMVKDAFSKQFGVDLPNITQF